MENNLFFDKSEIYDYQDQLQTINENAYKYNKRTVLKDFTDIANALDGAYFGGEDLQIDLENYENVQERAKKIVEKTGYKGSLFDEELERKALDDIRASKVPTTSIADNIFKGYSNFRLIYNLNYFQDRVGEIAYKNPAWFERNKNQVKDIIAEYNEELADSSGFGSFISSLGASVAYQASPRVTAQVGGSVRRRQLAGLLKVTGSTVGIGAVATAVAGLASGGTLIPAFAKSTYSTAFFNSYLAPTYRQMRNTNYLQQLLVLSAAKDTLVKQDYEAARKNAILGAVVQTAIEGVVGFLTGSIGSKGVKLGSKLLNKASGFVLASASQIGVKLPSHILQKTIGKVGSTITKGFVAEGLGEYTGELVNSDIISEGISNIVNKSMERGEAVNKEAFIQTGYAKRKFINDFIKDEMDSVKKDLIKNQEFDLLKSVPFLQTFLGGAIMGGALSGVGTVGSTLLSGFYNTTKTVANDIKVDGVVTRDLDQQTKNTIVEASDNIASEQTRISDRMRDAKKKLSEEEIRSICGD